MNKKIIIAAGGTAGHIYPAVSIIEYILNECPETEVTFIGTKKGMEKELTKSLNIFFKTVRSSGFSIPPNIFKKTYIYLKFLYNLTAGFFESLYIIKRSKPEFILGMGGYVCAPVFIAAILTGKKIAIHEQNYIPGRLNKFFARFSKYIFISFEKSESFFRKLKLNRQAEIIYTGNPLRLSVREYYKHEPDYSKWKCDKDRRTIVSFGGSLGAENINVSVIGLYNYLRNEKDIQIILISGPRFFKQHKKTLDTLKRENDGLIFNIYPYVSEIDKLYRIADLVISRSGATTVAELDYTMIPAILIPYPAAIDNHQFYNADYLVKKNLAVIIRDSDLNAGLLLNKIKNIPEKTFKSRDNKKTGKKGAGKYIEGLKGLKIIAGKILDI